MTMRCVIVWPTETVTLATLTGLNPLLSMCKAYEPMGRAAARNSPAGPAVSSLAAEEESCRTVIEASGRVPPDASTTTPCKVPVVADWPYNTLPTKVKAMTPIYFMCNP